LRKEKRMKNSLLFEQLAALSKANVDLARIRYLVAELARARQRVKELEKQLLEIADEYGSSQTDTGNSPIHKPFIGKGNTGSKSSSEVPDLSGGCTKGLPHTSMDTPPEKEKI
jgi:hypothetical protein